MPTSDTIEIWFAIHRKYVSSELWERVSTGGRKVLASIVSALKNDKDVAHPFAGAFEEIYGVNSSQHSLEGLARMSNTLL